MLIDLDKLDRNVFAPNAFDDEDDDFDEDFDEDDDFDDEDDEDDEVEQLDFKWGGGFGTN